MENKSFFGTVFRDYFSCSGRLNRKPYICRGIAVTFVSTALAFLLFFAFAGFPPSRQYKYPEYVWLHVALFILIFVLTIWVGFSLGVRRCHDVEKSGWWLLLGLIPYINVAWGLYLIFKRGTIGQNKYGDDPIRNDYDRIEDIADNLKEQHEKNFERK